jgi:predicted TPR repeat methyltransferase
MTITRNEFKELVHLYKDAFEKFRGLSDYYNEDLLDKLLFPTLNWMEEKLGLSIEDQDFHVLLDLGCGGETLLGYMVEEEADEEGHHRVIDIVYTSDLDEVYDRILPESRREE